jgi:glycosyltransferase involved in cell wall biosynthesis
VLGSSDTNVGMTPAVSVVVPVFNSATTIPLLIERLDKVLRQCAPEFEIVLVNDGSVDGSGAEMLSQAAKNTKIRPLDLMRNYGQHNALLAGIRAARGDVVVTIDDDLQNPPEEIPKLLGALANGHDLVYGRAERRRQTLLRRLATNLLLRSLVVATGNPALRDVTAFRAFKTSLRRGFRRFNGPYVAIDVLLSWSATNVGFVTVRHDQRAEGESGYTLRSLLRLGLNVLVGFSTWPLRAASIFGIGASVVGLGLLAYVLTRVLVFGSQVPGFPFLASVIIIFAGVELVALGVMGEYLARIHQYTVQRPPYVVRSESDQSNQP